MQPTITEISKALRKLIEEDGVNPELVRTAVGKLIDHYLLDRQNKV